MARRVVDILQNEEELEHFIELYRDQTNLWDTSCKFYHDKMKRKKSFKFILDALGDSKLTENDLKGKIQRLRSTLTREMRKEKASAKDGEIYQSRWRYYNKMEFLKPHIVIRDGLYPNVVVVCKAEPAWHDSHINGSQESYYTQSTPSSADYVQQQHKMENNGEESDSVFDYSVGTASPAPSTSSCKRRIGPGCEFERKKRKTNTEGIASALDIFARLVARQPQHQEVSDVENEYFAKYIATQLAKLPCKRQRQARRKILTVLDEMLDEHENEDFTIT